jgi:hypothetical protein
MADECIRHSKRELLLALAERLDQVLWCLLTATDPGCNEKARNRAALEAQKYGRLHRGARAIGDQFSPKVIVPMP